MDVSRTVQDASDVNFGQRGTTLGANVRILVMHIDGNTMIDDADATIIARIIALHRRKRLVHVFVVCV